MNAFNYKALGLEEKPMTNMITRITGTSYKLIAAIALMCIYASASAHTDLRSSIPGEGSVVNKAPEQIQLTFTAAVSLIKFSLTDSSGKEIELDFKPSTEAKTEYIMAMPLMQVGAYKVDWAVIGEDGHTVSNTIAFTIDPSATESHGHGAGGGHGH
jgi:methionine-rich copper-binding protein CopC